MDCAVFGFAAALGDGAWVCRFPLVTVLGFAVSLGAVDRVCRFPLCDGMCELLDENSTQGPY